MADDYFDKVSLLLPLTGDNNGTTFTDYSPTPKTVSVYGDTKTVTAQSKYYGSSAYFDGTYTTNGEHLTVPKTSDFDFGAGDYTIEAWIRLVALNTTNSTIVSTSFVASPYYSIRFRVLSTGALYMLVSMDGSAIITVSSAAGAIATNQWYHVAGVRNGSSIMLFIDGVLVGTTTGVSGSIYYSTRDPIHIGVDPSSNGTPSLREYFNGYIQDLRITKGVARYTANFTPPTETHDPYYYQVVLGLHMDGADNGTTFTDVKGNAVTRYGDTKTVTAVKKFGTASAYFDGAGDYLTVPHSANLEANTNFTAECWIYPGVNNATKHILDKRNSTTANRSWIFRTSSTGKLEVYAFDSAGTVIVSLVGSTTIGTSAWHHVALVVDGTLWLIYLNGVLEASATIGGTYAASGNALSIGRDPGDLSRDFNGYIDDLRITKGVARYTSNFTPPTAAFPEAMLPDFTPPTQLVKTVMGTVKDDVGLPCVRSVIAHERTTGTPFKTTSNSNGQWSLMVPDSEYYIVALDDDAGFQYNALIKDRVTPQ